MFARIGAIGAVVLAVACQVDSPPAAGGGLHLTSAASVRPDHIVVVVEENHSSAQIVGNLDEAPYFNGLVSQGALFTNSFGVEHPSQPNYLDLFSGSDQGVHDDNCPYSFSGPNLASALEAAGRSFVGYSEDLPAAGSTVCSSGSYKRKHNPWVDFGDVPAAANQPFAAFPTDFDSLPAVAWVVPNQDHDMHDGSVRAADDWLQTHIGAYVDWAASHNSLLIITWDEDDYSTDNRIATLFVGPMVEPMQAPERISHFEVLRTILDLCGVPAFNAAATASPIDDVWVDSGPTDYQRTVVFVHAVTEVGQDMFLRGGIDYDYARAALGRDCATHPRDCQIPIRHRNLRNPSTADLKDGDDALDWLGAEPDQDPGAIGSPMDWTTDQWPADWGPTRTVAVDGYGEEPLNQSGPHEWMLDVDMDCSKTVDGWFEIKSFIDGGPGWEPDVSQPGTPYPSHNHMARCGHINRFESGSDTAEIRPF